MHQTFITSGSSSTRDTNSGLRFCESPLEFKAVSMAYSFQRMLCTNAKAALLFRWRMARWNADSPSLFRELSALFDSKVLTDSPSSFCAAKCRAVICQSVKGWPSQFLSFSEDDVVHAYIIYSYPVLILFIQAQNAVFKHGLHNPWEAIGCCEMQRCPSQIISKVENNRVYPWLSFINWFGYKSVPTLNTQAYAKQREPILIK